MRQQIFTRLYSEHINIIRSKRDPDRLCVDHRLKHFRLSPAKQYRRIQPPRTDDHARGQLHFHTNKLQPIYMHVSLARKKNTGAQCDRINFHECKRVHWSITLREGFSLLIFLVTPNNVSLALQWNTVVLRST
jgi:hypothetical protein